MGGVMEVTTAIGDDFVAVVEIHRPPDNYFDADLIGLLADAYEALDANQRCRAILLCSEGKNFCAGADFASRMAVDPLKTEDGPAILYRQGARLFATTKPVVAAVQGAAVGGGLGLALSADFRVAAPEARFAANFARLSLHHGFGITVTLPRVVGTQRALELLLTGRRINGEEALATGLADRLAPLSDVRDVAHAFAAELASAGPLAVQAIRKTMRGDLAGLVRDATEHERLEQAWLRNTADFAEGVRAMAERRPPQFTAS